MANNQIPPYNAQLDDTAQYFRDIWWASLSEAQKTTNRHEVWMRRSGQWNGGRFGIDWQPEKILGQGSFGICCLFRYIGEAAHVPQQIVVKQSSGINILGLEQESIYLRFLNPSWSPHVVRLYASCRQEHGSGTHPEFDPPPDPNGPGVRTILSTLETDAAGVPNWITYKRWNENGYPHVARLYLEYCDLKNLNIYHWSKWGSKGESPPEDVVWRLWECLSRALFVLHRGAEDAFVRGWHPIIHFDCKPSNILVHDGADQPGHGDYDIFKFADFGYAQFAPGENHQADAAWIAQVAARGTDGHIAPELIRPAHPERNISMKADIFGVAAIMYDFMLGVDGVPDDIYNADCGPRRGRHIPTLCGDFVALNNGYSERFRKMLMRCLALKPIDRPDARELFKEIQEVIKIYDRAPDDPRLAQRPATSIWRGRDFPVANMVSGPGYNNPGFPDYDPPEVDVLGLVDALQPAITANAAGGKRYKWVPLPADVDEDEAGRVMVAITARENDDAMGVVPVDPAIGHLPWLYYAVQYVFHLFPNAY